MEKISSKNNPDGKWWGTKILSRLVVLIKSVLGPDQSVFKNTFYLVSTTVLTSALGYIFWIIAARKFSTLEVGIGATYINIVTLIALLGDMGFGITVIRFIVGLGENSRSFINTIILVEFIISLIVSILFVLVLPYWSKNLQGLSDNFIHLVLFMGTIISLLLAQLLDNNYIAFNKIQFFFFRNILSSIIRVIYLFFIGSKFGSLNIMVSVGLGSLLTLMLSWFFFIPRTIPGYFLRLEFSFNLLKERILYALSNQGSQLLYALTPLLFPLIILRILGPEANAKFYLCWMIANLLFIVPVSVATSTFAKITNSPVLNFGLLWKFLKITIIGLTIVIPILIFAGPWILGIFGVEYRLASTLLTWLILSSLPYSVNSFAVTFYRLNKKTSGLLIVSGVPAIFSIIFIVVGGSIGNLSGLGIGWFLAQSIGVIFSLNALIKIPSALRIIQKGMEDVRS